MRILVTNDDGIHSEGLWSVVRTLKEAGQVSVVAPDRDQSGMGAAVSLISVVRVQEVSGLVDGVKTFAVQGTPADCVILATETLFSEPFDLVVSGINQGSNLGLDVINSGTVGDKACSNHFADTTGTARNDHNFAFYREQIFHGLDLFQIRFSHPHEHSEF